MKTRIALPLLFLAMSLPVFAQTVTFTTQGGGNFPEHYTVVSEDGQSTLGYSSSGAVQIATPYGYPQSGIILPINPTAPGEWLNPAINIISETTTGNYGDPTRTKIFVFNTTGASYGYTWAGSFSVQLYCRGRWRGLCTGYAPGLGSGSMTATPVTQ